MTNRARSGVDEDEGVVMQMHSIAVDGSRRSRTTEAELANQDVGNGMEDSTVQQASSNTPDHLRVPSQHHGVAYPPRVHVRGHSRISIPNAADTARDHHASTAGTPAFKGSSTSTATATAPYTLTPTTKFAPLPEASRRQFARDSPYLNGNNHHHQHDDDLFEARKKKDSYGKPSSTDSLPLQRVTSHGRASIMEMDLADAAMEPMSAYEQAAPSMHEQAKRRRNGHHQHHQHMRRRRRTPSIASKQTKRTVRSRAGKAIERMRRVRRNSSSSSSSSSDSSSSSSSSGIDWRFWRSSTASSATDDSYIPPEPTFTLYTPRIKSSLSGDRLPSEHDLANMGMHADSMPHPYTSKSSEKRDKSANIHKVTASLPNPLETEVFDVLLSRTLNPCLDRLKEFWLERDQTEGIGGDIGASHLSTEDAPPPPPGPTTGQLQDRLSRANSSRMPSRGPSRNHSPDPSHPATSRKTRGTGAAWWLDVQCASTADMRQLRRLIPMHPLTIEDILSQETREKIETYEQLGYYFVAFRALDETYFKYSEESSSSSSPSTSKTLSREDGSGSTLTKVTSWLGNDKGTDMDNGHVENGKGKSSPEIEEKSLAASEESRSGSGKRKKGIVEIVEGHKEGVEGAGVGAVNVYLVVFGDGIISFHFEDISNHTNRVKNRIDNFGVAQHISSHWIAYGLMDSIVDTFFPLIDFIEAEADDIDAFLANPLCVDDTLSSAPVQLNGTKPSRLSYFKQYFRRLKPVWLQVRTPQVTQFFGVIKSTAIVTQREADFSNLGQGRKRRNLASTTQTGPKTLSHKALRGVNEDLYDRGKMLTRIAVARKLVMGLSRLLIPKQDVVRGLRKRLRDEKNRLGSNEPGQRHDIGIYLGDLQDHIITMQQTLNFFDTMLSHDHPAYLGVLRLAYEAAKIGNDKAIVRLNVILVMFLPVNIFCGLFGTNVYVPHNRVGPDGRPEALWAFGLVIIGVVGVVGLVIGYAYWAIRGTRKKYESKGVANRL